MAKTHQYLIYHINLTDQAVVESFQHAGTGDAVGAVLSAPTKLATQFSAPILDKTDPFAAPSITSEWFGASDFPRDVDVFERKSGGWFGVPWLFGDTIVYHWRGIYIYSPPAEVPGVGAPINIAPRRWIDGFEIPDPDSNNGGSEGSGLNDNRELTPTSSRHCGGMGWAWRNSTTIRQHLVDENIAGILPGSSWERFYVRLWRAPAVQAQLWSARSTLGSDGFSIEIMPSGQIAFGWTNTAGTFTAVGTTTALPIGVWKKIDLRFWFGVVGAGGNQFELWVNGVSAISGTVNALGVGSGPSGGLPPAWNAVTSYFGGNQVGFAGNAYQCIVAGPINGLLHDPTHADWMNINAGWFQTHANSRFGNGVANTMAIDIDDWMCGDHMGAADGVDFQNGSRVVLVRATGFDAASHDFAGDWRWCLVNPIDGADASLLASVTTGAKIVVTTDAGESVDALPESLGAVAIQLHVRQLPGDTTADLLGCAGAALSIVPAAVAPLTANWWKKKFARLTGTPTAVKIAPLTLSYEKVSNNSTKITHLSATVELIGSFGIEDIGPLGPDTRVLPAITGQHNNPYPRTPWARQTTAPVQPVYVKSGSYVGTGTFVDLDFPAPIHMLWRRTIGGGCDHWWSTMVGAHASQQLNGFGSQNLVQACEDGTFVPGTGETNEQLIDRYLWDAKAQTEGEPPTQVDIDYWRGAIGADPAAIVAGVLIDFWVQKLLGEGSTGPDVPSHGPYAAPPSALLALPAAGYVGDANPQMNFKLRIVGASARSNQVGVTYQYLAIGDPGQRFMTNGGLTTSGGAADALTQLFHQGFTPVGLFIRPEQMLGISVLAFYKGPGHAPSSLNEFSTGELANALAVGLHTITSKAAFHGAISDAAVVPFSALRIDDGSGHAGSVFQILSYVGNGIAGSRGIPLTPASGKRPLVGFVFGHNGLNRFRDPAHLTGTSSILPGGAGADGIIGGGIDSITVDIALNAAGVTYEVLVIPGGETAGIDGWSLDGEFWPVPPEPPPGAPGQEDGGGPEPGDAPGAGGGDEGGGGGGTGTDPIAPTGPMPGLADDLAPACEPDTRRMINVALSRIGISKQIANVLTDRTAEATSARLIYTDAIQTTLRDFPWPFATRYAQLAVLNGGARPNTDWRYAYRQPSDCLFERRIVVSRTDVANPDGVPFQLSSDFDPGDVAADPPAPTGGGIIYTNLQNAVLEYTARPKCPHTKTEPLFRDAAAWKMAEMMAPALSKMTDATVLCAKAYQGALDQAYVVLRPGNAGDVPATATIDVAQAAKDANLAVANAALIQIGAKTIRNLTNDQSREAQLVRIVFEQELRATLRDFPWPFATVYVAPVRVGGTSTVPVNADWQYSYRLPADLVFARRLVTGRRRAYEPNPATFKVAQDATGGLLFTDVPTTPAVTEPMTLEYTNRPEGVVLVADPLFRDALSWRLSWRLAPSLALLVPDRPEAVGRGPDDSAEKTKERTSTGASLRARAAATARDCYYFALRTAELGAAREQQIDVAPVDASWITERD